MCPNCTAAAFLVIAGLFLTPWRALLAVAPHVRRISNVK
jgi:hypothetical protein